MSCPLSYAPLPHQPRALAEDPNENNRTWLQLERIGKLGGMFGLGSDGVKGSDYLAQYMQSTEGPGRNVKRIGAGRVAFGTDLNGLVSGPRPAVTAASLSPQDMAKYNQQVKACFERVYNSSFVRSKTGDKEWNYCSAGVAHYGMLADFLQDIYGQKQGAFLQTNIMRNAEMFARMWEKAVKNSKNVPL